MKLKLAALTLIAFVCWLVPLKTLAQETYNPQQTAKTKPSEDYTSQNIVIKNNAIQPIFPLPKETPKPVRPTQPSGRYTAANGDIQLRMQTKVIVKWGEAEWPAMHFILDHESGSNPYAINKTSGACGIPQALPCSKLLSVIGSLDNIDGQLDWMINYIAARYETPTGAFIFWQSHHWY